MYAYIVKTRGQQWNVFEFMDTTGTAIYFTEMCSRYYALVTFDKYSAHCQYILNVIMYITG